MAPVLRFVVDELTHPAVIALLDHHLAWAHDASPMSKVHALDVRGLRDPAVTIWSAWERDALLGLGALKQLDPAHGELKSMRTAPGHLRRGVGGAMLDHLLAEARRRGYARVSLETGGTDAFAPARAMYERAGFAPCAAFGGYTVDDFSRCYTLALV